MPPQLALRAQFDLLSCAYANVNFKVALTQLVKVAGGSLGAKILSASTAV